MSEVLDQQHQTEYDEMIALIHNQFEMTYLSNNKHASCRNEHGDYVLPSIQDAWAGWRSARLEDMIRQNLRITELENKIKVMEASEHKAKETSDALFAANKRIKELEDSIK